MEFIVLDLEQATEVQLLNAINANVRTARLVSSEVENLKKASKSARKYPKQHQKNDALASPASSNNESKDQAFEDEVAYYYSSVKASSKEELSAHLDELLPSKDNHQYERILRRLQLELSRNIKEIKEFIATEDLDDEDLSELEGELLEELEKISIIGTSLTSVEEPVIIEEKASSEENNLIFVPTPGGNIRVLDELDRISPEYYARFRELFQSIKNGTFKNEQRQRGDSNLAGLCLVRHFNIRVAYTRLDENNYAVLTTFIKKADRDKATTASLASKYSDYKAIEPKLIANLGNEEFMALNKQYEEELFTKLSPAEKTTPAVKQKVGDK